MIPAEIMETIMSKESSAITKIESLRGRILLFGGVLGALIGVAAAYIYLQRAQEKEELRLSAGEGVKLGMMVLGLLRSIAKL